MIFGCFKTTLIMLVKVIAIEILDHTSIIVKGLNFEVLKVVNLATVIGSEPFTMDSELDEESILLGRKVAGI